MKALFVLFFVNYSIFAKPSIEIKKNIELKKRYCPKYSKNPQCYEGPNRSCENDPRCSLKYPRPLYCFDYKYSTKIQTISETTGKSKQASFSCSGTDLSQFNCSHLFDLYGKNIVGMDVIITVKRIFLSNPGCHIIGGCGSCKIQSTYAQKID